MVVGTLTNVVVGGGSSSSGGGDCGGDAQKCEQSMTLGERNWKKN